jgi:enolase-phosphatase E1
MSNAIVVDIEGTTSSLHHVHDHLFPYAAKRLPQWLPHNAGTPTVSQAIAQTRELAGRPDAQLPEVVAILLDWIAQDRKATPLKTMQGLIWAEGYAAGELTSHVYDDVPPALAEWARQGRPVYVYSSGSVLAQQQWFGHCPQGDLRPYFAGYFDTVTAGPKRESRSYEVIAARIGGPGLFLSDVGAELDAARAAGWSTIGVRRAGSPPVGGDHREITSFARLRAAGPAPR